MHQVPKASENAVSPPLTISARSSATRRYAPKRSRDHAIAAHQPQQPEVVTIPKDFWVTIQRYAAMSGYSVGALRQKIRRNQLIEGRHYRHARDGRIHMHVQAMQDWGTGK